jgi:hypothetical protein
VRVNTGQHEQYGVTVHLSIGMGRSPVEITFMSLITNYKHDTNYQRLNGLFLFKSVRPSSQGMSSCRSSLGCSFGIHLRVISACTTGATIIFDGQEPPNKRPLPPKISYFWRLRLILSGSWPPEKISRK